MSTKTNGEKFFHLFYSLVPGWSAKTHENISMEQTTELCKQDVQGTRNGAGIIFQNVDVSSFTNLAIFPSVGHKMLDLFWIPDSQHLKNLVGKNKLILNQGLVVLHLPPCRRLKRTSRVQFLKIGTAWWLSHLFIAEFFIARCCTHVLKTLPSMNAKLVGSTCAWTKIQRTTILRDLNLDALVGTLPPGTNRTGLPALQVSFKLTHTNI